MSASSMAASTCMSDRLRAMTNSSGACRLAATVWPDLDAALDDDAVHRRADLRALQVDPRLLQLRLALLDDGLRVLLLRARHRHLRLRHLQRSRPAMRAARLAVSSSAGEMKFCATRSCLRFSSRCASARSTWRASPGPARSARWPAPSAPRRAPPRRRRWTGARGTRRSPGRAGAISWPSLTSLLKSTNSSLICPDTCELTCTCAHRRHRAGGRHRGLQRAALDLARCESSARGSGTRTKNHQPAAPSRARSSAAPTQRDVFIVRDSRDAASSAGLGGLALCDSLPLRAGGKLTLHCGQRLHY